MPNTSIGPRQLPSSIKESGFEKKVNQVLMLFGSMLSAEHVSTAVELILNKNAANPILELLFATQSKVPKVMFK